MTGDNEPATHPTDRENGSKKVLRFPYKCTYWTKPAKIDMCIMNTPHFKDLVIISLTC